MSPLCEREAGMDDMSDYACNQPRTTTPFAGTVAAWLADAREMQRRLAQHAQKDVEHAYYRWLAEQLLAKLQGAQTALEAGHFVAPVRGREPLEGMLMLDIQPEAAQPLTFGRAG